MRLAEINECAWRLSAHAMMEEGGKWVVCSTGKLREIYAKTSSDGFKEETLMTLRDTHEHENAARLWHECL